MNPIRACFCRVCQAVLHLALPLLPYREPDILPSISAIPPLLRSQSICDVLLVTDRRLRESGATAALETRLSEGGIRCAVYDSTRPNPTVQNVEEALCLYRRANCQALIAFGGGSSMDCAKAVGARVVYPRKPLNRMKGLLKVLRKLPPLIAIPTTAGTGSEVTITAVITDGERKHKYTMNDFTLIPSHAVLDPEVTLTLPPSLTATTGMDALTHAVEAYIGRSTTRETRKLALEAVHSIFQHIETAYTDGRNRQARQHMLTAAYKAGIAFSKSYVGYVHAVAHSLGGAYNIPHGLANAVLLPVVLEVYGDPVHPKLHELAVAAGVAAETDSHRAGAEAFITAIRALNEHMGIPTAFPEIQRADIPRMAKHADREANPLYPVPVLMTAKELEAIYLRVAEFS